jgi:hypothetical protein
LCVEEEKKNSCDAFLLLSVPIALRI